MSFTIAWDKVTYRPLADLQPGDQWVRPAPFTIFWVSADGNTVAGNSWWMPLTGQLITLIARNGDQITTRDADGTNVTVHSDPRTQVLRLGTTCKEH